MESSADVRSSCDLEIIIKFVNECSKTVYINPSENIATLKKNLESFDGVTATADKIRLIYRGKVLRDEDSIESHNIQSGHTVHAVIRNDLPNESSSGENHSSDRNTNQQGSRTSTNSNNRSQFIYLKLFLLLITLIDVKSYHRR